MPRKIVKVTGDEPKCAKQVRRRSRSIEPAASGATKVAGEQKRTPSILTRSTRQQQESVIRPEIDHYVQILFDALQQTEDPDPEHPNPMRTLFDFPLSCEGGRLFINREAYIASGMPGYLTRARARARKYNLAPPCRQQAARLEPNTPSKE